MYGFHKIPHLQQGVLRSDSDTEPWHFEHPHFHRGQPDLLCLIQRKKQPAHGMGDDTIQMDVHEPAHIAAPPINNLTNGQVLDINSVVNGIAAIKRHQQAISADLNELKTSNQQLWQEALAARERHKKHQDTINRILKFLAGVFGHTAATGQHKADGSPDSPPRVVIPRKRQRLMIQDVDKEKEPQAQVVEEEDSRPRSSDGSTSGEFCSTSSSEQSKSTSLSVGPFASISTPETTVRSPSIGPSESSFSPSVSELPSGYFPGVQAIRPTDVLSRSSTVDPSKETPANGSTSLPTTPNASIHSLTTGQSQSDQANMWNVLQMFNSPSSMQKLMQALQSQQAHPMANLPDPPHTATSTAPENTVHSSDPSSSSSQQVMMYDPNAYDLSRFAHLPAEEEDAGPMLSALTSPLHDAEEDPTTSLKPLLDNATRLQNSYQDAADIESDVDALHLSINSLIEGLGLDPHSMSTGNHTDGLHDDTAGSSNPVAASTSSSSLPNGSSASSLANGHTSNATSPVLEPISADPPPDFDFENFFNELTAHSNADGLRYPDSFVDGTEPLSNIPVNAAGDNQEQLAAFLDEVTPTTASASPLVEELTASAAAQQQASKAKKRKSDVMDLPTALESTDAPSSTDPQPKPKKKR